MKVLRNLLNCITSFLALSVFAQPAVSPPRDIGDFPLLPAVWNQEAPLALTDGHGYLLLYRHGLSSSNLRAARVSASGEVLDPFGIEIGSALYRFSAIWTGSYYLVSWTREQCEPTGIRCLQLTAIEPSGEVRDLTRLPILDGASLAIRDGSILVSWEEWDSVSQERVVRGMVLGSDLDPGPIFELLRTDVYSEIVEPVATSRGFLVIVQVQDSFNARRLIAIPIASDGVRGAPQLVAEGDLFAGDVGSTDSATALLFSRRDRLPEFVSIDDEGRTLIEPVPLLLGAGPQLLPDGEAFLVVSGFSSVITQTTPIMIQTLSLDGVLGPLWSLGETVGMLRAASASADGLLIVSQELKGDGWTDPGGWNQTVAAFDRTLQPRGEPSPLMLSAPVQRRSALAAAGDVVLHVWEEYRDGIWQIYSQPMTHDEEPAAWPLDHPYGDFSVASDGETFLLAISRARWVDGTLEWYPEVRLLDRNGELLMTREFPGSGFQRAVVFDGVQYVLLWDERLRDRYPDVSMLSPLNETLEPRGEPVVIDHFARAVGFDGKVLLLNTIEGERPYPDLPPTTGLDVRVATTAGEVIVGPRQTLLEPSVGPTRTLAGAALATNGREVLVVWQQYESDGAGIWGHREVSALIDRSGNVVAEAHGALDQTRDTAAESMTWDGLHFVATNLSEQGDRLLVQYLDRTGARRDFLEIPVDSYGNAMTSIASAGGGQVVIDYSAFVTNERVGVGVERVLTQTITNGEDRKRSVRRRAALASNVRWAPARIDSQRMSTEEYLEFLKSFPATEPDRTIRGIPGDELDL